MQKDHIAIEIKVFFDDSIDEVKDYSMLQAYSKVEIEGVNPIENPLDFVV